MLNHLNTNIDKNLLIKESQLTEIFFSGMKDYDVMQCKRVGVEFEKLPIKSNTFKAAAYQDIVKFLSAYKGDRTVICENNAILGLADENGTISLEPGSQTEISLNPSDNLNIVKRILDCYNSQTAQIAQKYGICWLGCGIQPVSTYKSINIIPKKRYEYMTQYLPTVAKKPLIMMRETAGIQASFDYKSEEDAMRKFSFALKLSPFISAAYSNSPIRNGRLTKYKSNRAASWLDTDNARCGLVSSKVFNSEFSFSDYAQQLLDVPMIFIERVIDGVKTAIRVQNLTFRMFMKNGYQGFSAEKQDWLTHLSLYFTDVRLKNYIEIRNHDNQRTPLICSVPALWKGLIYNDEAMCSVEELLKRLNYFDCEYVRRKAPQKGLDMKIKNLSLRDIVTETVKISYESLKSYGNDEEKLLEPLLELCSCGLTPADIVINNWENDWYNNFSGFINYSKLV